MKSLITLSLSILLSTVSVPALHGTDVAVKDSKLAPRPIAIGETITLSSEILAEAREINIYLPPDYEKTDRTYPVLYLIDGGLEQDFLHVAGTVHLGALWARSRMVIVVGIATKDRRRELTGPTRSPELLKSYPTAGSSALFRAFIRDEVIPVVEKNYRVSEERGVIGESLAGLFVVETFLRESAMFNHYAAISPSLWWDDGRLAAEAKQPIATNQDSDPTIYLTMADEGSEIQGAMETLVGALEGRRGWCYSPKPELTHATIYHSVSPEALQFLFPHPEKPDARSGFDVACKAGPGRR